MAGSPVVALIGMRGAGKTTLGKGLAQLLGFDFEDLDEAITQAAGGKKPPEIVAEKGWDEFRKLEADCFEAASAAKKSKVVACGGGIIETTRGMELMRSHSPVIFIDRHIYDVIITLGGDPSAQVHRASLGESPQDTYKRRLPKYVEAANFRFPVARREADLASLTLQFARFVSVALGDVVPPIVSDSFFISLTAQDYSQAATLLRDASMESDVLEFRVDLLASLEPENIAHQVALIRRSAPATPLLYTVRSADHGGKFAGSEEEYFKLNFLGLQLCAEFLDVECTWSASRIAELVARRGPSQLIGSYHNFGRMLSRSELKDVFQSCLLDGAAAIAKVVVKAEAREDNWIVQEVGKATTPESAAFIGLCLGEKGKLSRVLNQVMCPSMCSSPLLPPGAPGQMAVPELLDVRKRLGLQGPHRHFAVLAPWDDPQAGLYCRVLAGAFRALKVGHQVAREGPEALDRVLGLASTGGAVLLGHVCSARPELQDCVSLSPETKGSCCKAEALKELLGSKPGTGAVLGPAATARPAFERVVPVADLAQAKELAAVVFAGMEKGTSIDELRQKLEPALKASKPRVVDMSPPCMEAPGWLLDLASSAGCEVVTADAFLLEEILAILRWWQLEASRGLIAKVIIAELTKLGRSPCKAVQAAGEAWA